MFWEAIKGGLLILTHWETYAAIGIYLAMFLIPLMALSIAMEKMKQSVALVSSSAR